MYLKSLKLVGFKSFADRTRLEFRSGVTVVVGPNGSGKSNVVDAVAWVMGTQSPKALRTTKMDDLIFAGTATRPGLGRAEVTLVLDNGSGALPVDLPEVSITRRLYRDGSTDYEINGVGCRLLDIQELLSDSGVGRHQHVIIGQGQIDSILSATGEDHRAVIEEAAGILKHRVRKEKAIRRLERTDADVLRLQDLLGELKRQMRPLKRQANAAARHDEVAALVRSLVLYLGGEDLRSITGRTRALAAEQAGLDSALSDAEQRRGELDSKLSILRESAGEVGQALERDTAAAARIETTVERLRRIASVAHERHRAGMQRLLGADERRRDLEEERAELRGAIEATQSAEAETRLEMEAAERRFRGLEDEERSLADQESMTTEGAVAIVRGDLRSLDAAEERDTREMAAIDRQLEGLAGRVGAAKLEHGRINDEITELDSVVVEAQTRYERAQKARVDAQEAWESAEADHTDARVSLAAARAKIEAVEQAVSGVADAEGRAIVERSHGAVGSIAHVLDVPSEWAQAVDAALGHWVDGVAFESADDVDRAVADVKRGGHGGVPVLGRSDRTLRSTSSNTAEETGLQRLVDLLGPAADRILAEQLLGDVIVVEGWKTGRRIAQDHPDVRVVTPEGDVITASGVWVAHPDGATPAMLEAARADAERSETDLARSASILTQTRRIFEEQRQAERDQLEMLESLEARLAGATESLARTDRSIADVEHEQGRLTDRRRQLFEAGSERAEQRATLLERLSALEGEEAERQRAWEELVARRQEISTRRETARAEWQDLSAVHRATAERLDVSSSRLRMVEGLLASEAEGTLDPERLERLAVVEGAARQAIEALRINLEGLRARQEELRARVGSTGRQMTDLQVERERVTETLDAGRSRMSSIAIELAELRVRAESVAEGIRRDADASEETALAAPAPDIEGDPREVLVAKQAELRRMGPINPLAASEYAELSERHDFMTAQLDDLESSRADLRRVISALDEEIESRFVDAFEEIASAYESHFSVLFPGGRGELTLTDPNVPLTSGVEIHAQPLGKKVSKMTLLSGGERSLAALAFLFAVFRARPSPFYVLDEVEAALDDANLHRFLRLLDAFRDDAQLIVVTHQQQTMEAADVLYGVTMEPGGSSKVVAKVLEEVPIEA